MSRINIKQIDEYLLLVNLYLTQALTLSTGFIIYYIFYFRQGLDLNRFFQSDDVLRDIGIGLALGLVFVGVNLLAERFLPEKYFDDGGINEKIFSGRHPVHIFLISFIVAVSEEFLFRVMIQPLMGIFWTSVLFTLIHVRYLRYWIMPLMVFVISYVLGWSYNITENAWTPIVAHMTVDLILGLWIRLGWNGIRKKDF
ncbi:MAG: CPBP family intramembrane metalloprotease [Bacillaceae bacterium]|nr:CPBP family intramembrane metalloprotease [Bacillaceae bacterium]